jgi:hypothetical protein
MSTIEHMAQDIAKRHDVTGSLPRPRLVDCVDNKDGTVAVLVNGAQTHVIDFVVDDSLNLVGTPATV